ncbi:MAG TPA: trigger factor [Acidimicrobiales bacterium]|jgi:trigger factor
MKTVVEPLEGNKVKLSVEIDEHEFEKALDAAFRKIAREVRIPGFRPGKAPRRVLEARLGKDVARQEALKDALPDYYSRALRDEDVDAIAAPEIDITSGEEDGPVAFDAVVEIRPHLQLAGYNGLRVEIPSPEVAEEDITSQIDRLRNNFGELTTIARPARDGDFLTVDLKGTRHGEPVAGMSTDDLSYELGSGTVLPELDTELQGARAGDIFKFTAELPDGPVTFQVLVKEVKEKVLPEVTDEWASEASEFDTVEELRQDLVDRIGGVKRLQAGMALRNQVVEAVVELVTEDPPEPLVEAELERRAHDLAHRLEAQGATIAQYLEATGQTEEQLVEELRQGATTAVKADLALRAVADAEEIEVSDDEVQVEVERMAERLGQKPAQLQRQLERAEQMPAVRSDIRKGKALEWLADHVEIVDSEGRSIDRALLEPGKPDADASGEDPLENAVETEEA